MELFIESVLVAVQPWNHVSVRDGTCINTPGRLTNSAFDLSAAVVDSSRITSGQLPKNCQQNEADDFPLHRRNTSCGGKA